MADPLVRNAVTDWMNKQGIRDPSNISTEDYANLMSLLGQDRKGFGVFLSLMHFYRSLWAQSLANADLSNSAGAVAAAKLQGCIQCVDTMRDLVLDIADPIGPDSRPSEEIAGVSFNG